MGNQTGTWLLFFPCFGLLSSLSLSVSLSLILSFSHTYSPFTLPSALILCCFHIQRQYTYALQAAGTRSLQTLSHHLRWNETAFLLHPFQLLTPLAQQHAKRRRQGRDEGKTAESRRARSSLLLLPTDSTVWSLHLKYGSEGWLQKSPGSNQLTGAHDTTVGKDSVFMSCLWNSQKQIGEPEWPAALVLFWSIHLSI